MTTSPMPSGSEPELGLPATVSERRNLTSLAYRLLGSLSEAEDAVQETYARWYSLTADERAVVASPGAWLTTVASRICLDLLGSARARRERYVGAWIPEPLPSAAEQPAGSAGYAIDPADQVSLDESVSMAFLVVLESMTPAERVAFILHDVFGYPFADIAAIVGRSPGACRQLASSARHRAAAAQPPASPTALQAGIVRDFKRAWQAGDIDAMIGLLDPDAVATADGGGLATAFPAPIHGAGNIARRWLDIARAAPGLTCLERTVNGQPGLIAQQEGVTVSVLAFEIVAGRITRIWVTRNPRKLRPWTTRLSATAA